MSTTRSFRIASFQKFLQQLTSVCCDLFRRISSSNKLRHWMKFLMSMWQKAKRQLQMFLFKAECHSVLFYGENVQSYSRVCDFGLLSVRVLIFCVFFFKSSLQPLLLLWPEVVGRKLGVELVIQVVKLVVGRGRPRTRSRSTVQ